MQILVDYANLPNPLRQRSPSVIADAILTAIGVNPFEPARRCNIRFYGGWYQDAVLTKVAQDLAVSVDAEFPRVFRFSGATGVAPIAVTAEMAYSISTVPHRHLFHTYRPKRPPHNLRCHDHSVWGCNTTPCVLSAVYNLIETGRCPAAGCNTRMEDVMYRGEQKLVDGMLSTDLLAHVATGTPRIAIVTSDDDFWPPILHATASNCAVFHVLTKSTLPRTPSYQSLLTAHYYPCRL